jgi:beta-galactosidase
MFRKYFFTLLVVTSTLCSNLFADKSVPESVITDIGKQLIRQSKWIGNQYAEYTVDGEWHFGSKVGWLSGFIGGEYWIQYELTGDERFKKLALSRADMLLKDAGIDRTHDMGFIFLPTVVEAFKKTGEEKYRTAGLLAAEMLAKRFNENGNFIRAWGKLGEPKKSGWMIIDTMMNLELLFWAAMESGNSKYYEIAYKHALTTLEETVRANASSYHVVEFNPQTGAVEKKRTHQGNADESTWGRGQAWGIYGFANAYKFTKDERFLTISRKMADYFIAHLPEDMVNYWDLDLSGSDVRRDASAAAIATSGMLILSEMLPDYTDARYYENTASKITTSLVDKYLYTKSTRGIEQGLLLKTIYHNPKKWGVSESFPAGDYYFMESVQKLVDLDKIRSPFVDLDERQVVNINQGWGYLENNFSNLSDLKFISDEWKSINLPHTWNAFDAVDATPGYRRDASWYKKTIFLPELTKGQEVLLSFEGVNLTSDVYINGKRAGGYVGGYLGFDVNITDYVRYDQENEIYIRVDNSVNPTIVPSQKADFFIYGGITRDVFLKLVPAVSISDMDVNISKVSKSSARTEVVLSVDNTGKRRSDQINIQVKDSAGKTVLSYKKKKTIKAGSNDIKISLSKLKNPHLWSPDDPHLYTVTAKIGESGDWLTDKIGYRWFEFEEHGPFKLNGERMLLKGTHRHEEWAGYGNAMPNSLHIKDMQMIKDVGANFVRLAHYPQDPAVYAACDSLGLLVWDEVPWCRGGVGPVDWQNNTMNMLEDMIDQNRNHPSVILWSMGNEVYWMPDFEGGGEIDEIRNFMIKMHLRAKELDPSRMTSTRKFYEGADIVDVFSPSIWAGWYGGYYKNFEKAIAKSRKDYSRFFHMEYGGSSHVGRHNETPITGSGTIDPEGWEEDENQVQVKNVARTSNWDENYIVDLFDWHLNVSAKMDWLTGNAQWAFKDFGTPLRPENSIPYINQKGIVDREGKPKDSYYTFKSYWVDEPDFVYIESHTWTERIGPSGKAKEISVFSNCEIVELIHNGVSLGERVRDKSKFPAQGLTWDVVFTEGENTLLAHGYATGNLIDSDTLEVKYWYSKPEKPNHIELSASKLSDGNYLVAATVVDKNGRRCLDYEELVYFDLSGSGKLLVDLGTPTGSSVIEFANGQASVVYKPVPGESATIEARNQSFKGDYIRIGEND